MSESKNIKVLLGAGAILLILYLILIEPSLDNIEQNKRLLTAKEHALTDVRLIQQEFVHTQKAFDSFQKKIEKAGKAPAFAAELEGLASALKIKNQITAMKPLPDMKIEDYTGISMELKLEELPLKKLVEFLYKVEHQNILMTIKRLEIRQRPESNGKVDALLHVASFVKG